MQPQRVSNVDKRALGGKRIGFFGKGGAGKSTAVVMIARALERRGYDVCVLDADSTNAGLAAALGLEQCPAPLMDYYGGMVFGGGPVTCPVDDPTPLQGASISLEELPSQYVQRRGPMIFLTAGKITDQGPGPGCDGPMAKIARDMRLCIPGRCPVTLVDFKAGFEDSARGVLTGLDWVIIVVDPSVASIDIAAHMRTMVRQIQSGVLPATKHLDSAELVSMAHAAYRQARIRDALCVLNRVPSLAVAGYLRERLAERGLTPPLGAFREDPQIAAAWLQGRPLQAQEIDDEADRVVAKLIRAEAAHA